jgi:hypothetical protein
MNTALLHARPPVKSLRSVVRQPPVAQVALRPVPVISMQDKAVFRVFSDTNRFSLAAFKQAYSQ